MTLDLQEEYRKLSWEAQRQLREVPASGSYTTVCSWWKRPSFAPSFRCTIYEPLPFAKKSRPMASFTIWRRDLDLEKFASPVERLRHPKVLVPTLEGDTLWLNDGEVETIIRRLSDIPIPFFLGPPSIIGCDGTGYEFSYHKGFSGGTLSWWENKPEVWGPFTSVVREIFDGLEARRKAAPLPPGTDTPNHV